MPSEPPRVLERPLSQVSITGGLQPVHESIHTHPHTHTHTHTRAHTHTQVSDTDGIGEACAGGKMLEFRPKARVKDVENYIDSCRTKFGCFESDGSADDLVGELVKGLTLIKFETYTVRTEVYSVSVTYLYCIIWPTPYLQVTEYYCIYGNPGLPQPIKESIGVLRKHIYIPLSDVQITEEEKIQQQRRYLIPSSTFIPTCAHVHTYITSPHTHTHHTHTHSHTHTHTGLHF